MWIIVLSIAVIIISLGFIFWLIDILFETDDFFPEDERTLSPIWKILLCFFTGGLYSLYWWYKIGKNLHNANKKKISDKSWLYFFIRLVALVCTCGVAASNVAEEYEMVPNEANGSLIGIGLLIMMILVQKDLNLLKESKKKTK